MTGYTKTTCYFLAIIVISGGALPALAGSHNDDFSGLFEYFSKEEQKARNQGIILERTKRRKRGTSTTLSLFGRGADPLPDSFARSNFRSREWKKNEPTTILNLRLDF